MQQNVNIYLYLFRAKQNGQQEKDKDADGQIKQLQIGILEYVCVGFALDVAAVDRIHEQTDKEYHLPGHAAFNNDLYSKPGALKMSPRKDQVNDDRNEQQKACPFFRFKQGEKSIG